MYERLTRKLVEKAMTAGIIQQDEEELYLYAYQSLLAGVVSWCSLLLIAAVLQSFFGAVLYMIFFIPLRMFAGGYHEGSYLRCYVLSLCVYIGLVVLCPILAPLVPLWAVCVVLLAGAVVIFFRAPVADPNKPLDADEQVKYRGSARLVLASELFVFAFMVYLEVPPALLLFVAAAPITVALLLLHPGRREEQNT